MNRIRVPLLICSLLLLMVLPQNTAFAHQPYCEQTDLTAENPWQVPDATVSYAYFGNLYPETDIDYFTFDAAEGQSVLLSLSIPAYDGAEEYAPVMVLMGPGIEGDVPASLPDVISVAADHGAMMVPVGEEPEYWFEPFGGQYYYNWENYFFETPEDATYTVALWHPQGELGRYSFVVGEEEIRGGDPECMAGMGDFWTPLIAGESPYPETEMAKDDSHMHDDGEMHDHSELLEMTNGPAPFVDLQVMSLADGGYNVRIQTLNFTFAPQKAGMEPVTGEGHAYLYIDGEKIARIYGEWYHLESLPDDAEMLSVSLYANNHQTLSIDGKAITDMVMVADVMASMKSTAAVSTE